MSRKCSTCQHVRRAEIDRRLAGGEPGNDPFRRIRAPCVGVSVQPSYAREVFRANLRHRNLRCCQFEPSPSPQEREILHLARGKNGRQEHRQQPLACREPSRAQHGLFELPSDRGSLTIISSSTSQYKLLHVYPPSCLFADLARR
jgi:hypothetical protein